MEQTRAAAGVLSTAMYNIKSADIVKATAGLLPRVHVNGAANFHNLGPCVIAEHIHNRMVEPPYYIYMEVLFFMANSIGKPM